MLALHSAPTGTFCNPLPKQTPMEVSQVALGLRSPPLPQSASFLHAGTTQTSVYPVSSTDTGLQANPEFVEAHGFSVDDGTHLGKQKFLSSMLPLSPATEIFAQAASEGQLSSRWEVAVSSNVQSTRVQTPTPRPTERQAAGSSHPSPVVTSQGPPMLAGALPSPPGLRSGGRRTSFEGPPSPVPPLLGQPERINAEKHKMEMKERQEKRGRSICSPPL